MEVTFRCVCTSSAFSGVPVQTHSHGPKRERWSNAGRNPADLFSIGRQKETGVATSKRQGDAGFSLPLTEVPFWCMFLSQSEVKACRFSPWIRRGRSEGPARRWLEPGPPGRRCFWDRAGVKKNGSTLKKKKKQLSRTNKRHLYLFRYFRAP